MIRLRCASTRSSIEPQLLARHCNVWSIPSGLTIDVAKGPISTPTVGGGIAQTSNDQAGLLTYVRDKTCVAAFPLGPGSYYVTDTRPFTWKKDDSNGRVLHRAHRRLDDF